jgi:hypothetical protein
MVSQPSTDGGDALRIVAVDVIRLVIRGLRIHAAGEVKKLRPIPFTAASVDGKVFGLTLSRLLTPNATNLVTLTPQVTESAYRH